VKTGWLARERKRRAKLDEDKRLREVVHRVALALGEVKVVERRKDGVVLDRAVANKDALVRARRAYRTAATAIGAVRIAAGTATGRTPLDRERRVVLECMRRLTGLERELTELERL